MARVYLDSKKVCKEPDLYSGYDVLNLYCEKKISPMGSEKINLYGLFLSDVPAYETKHHGNEVHFPILFTRREQAESLFGRIKSHSDIKRFQESLDVLVGLEGDDLR